MNAAVAGAKMGRPKIQPSEEMRRSVETMSAFGVSAQDIARAFKTSVDTLRRHFRDELDNAAARANTKVAGFLFKAAREGNVTAQIFWLKTRARWKEAPIAVEHTGANGGPLAIVHALLDDIDARARDPRVIEHQGGKEPTE